MHETEKWKRGVKKEESEEKRQPEYDILQQGPIPVKPDCESKKKIAGRRHRQYVYLDGRSGIVKEDEMGMWVVKRGEGGRR